MSMNRNDALSQIAKQNKFNMIPASHIIDSLDVPTAFQKALDTKDLAFFKLHADKPASSVALGCIHGRVWPPKIDAPLPSEISMMRNRAKLSQTAAAALIYSTMRTWQDWEAGIAKMHPGLYELFCLKTS